MNPVADLALMPAWYAVAVAAVFGAVIGSFLNVVVYRLPNGISVVSPPSACPKCGHTIRGYDNVPVLGWLWLRGKCRDCRNPISWRYPAVEAATALAFAWVTATFRANGLIVTLTLLAVMALSIALALIDLDVMRLPDKLTGLLFAIVVVGLGLAALTGENGWPRYADAGLGALAVGGGYFAFWFLTGGRGMGFGDVKLAPSLGAITGWFSWPAVIFGVAAGWVIGAIIGTLGLLTGVIKRGRPMPFGPFMLAGTWIGLAYGEQLADWYLQLVGFA